MCDFITPISNLPFCNSLPTLLSWILQSDLWELIESYNEKGNIFRQKPEATVLGKCTWMHLFNSQSFTFPFSDQFANTLFLKPAMGYFLAQWSLQWQRKYPQMKTRRNPALKLLGDKWIHPTELDLCFLEQSINTVFEEPEKGYCGWHSGRRW